MDIDVQSLLNACKGKPVSQKIYTTDFGSYVIPADLVARTKFTKRGHVDRRFASANEFWAWLLKVEHNETGLPRDVLSQVRHRGF